VRLLLFPLLLVCLAGCGRLQGVSSFGDVPIVLGDRPGADEAGVFLATARGYDTAEGVTLQVQRSGVADFRLTARPPARCITVMVVVRPSRLVLCADEITLQDERDKVVAVVRALRRGYVQAQLEPAEAVAATEAQLTGVSGAELSTALDEAAPTWTAGARYFGQVQAGPGRDPTVVEDALEDTD
jgi:hypothetical protein